MEGVGHSMPNANYRRGAAFERAVMERLRLLGYECWRSAGSHSPADVVALRPCIYRHKDGTKVILHEAGDLTVLYCRALLVQAKAGRTGHLSERDRVLFIAYAKACGATACYADQVQGIGVRIVELESGQELG